MAVLELRGATKRFPGVLALDDVSLEILPGEIHALVGENGAGKSTLLSILSGVFPPDDGQILLGGAPAAFSSPAAARAAGVVCVHQEADLFDTLSIAENMALEGGMPTHWFGLVHWSEIRRFARAALDAIEEPLDERRIAGGLSVAQRHLAQLAAALLRPARVLILDEPTSVLSAAETARLFSRLRGKRASGVAVVYVSHRQDEIFELADRITVLRDGTRVWTGPASAVDRGRLVSLMVGREHAPRVRCIAAAADHRPLLFETAGLTDPEGAFAGISLRVHAGEVVGLYGLVGAGRSEWAQAVFGLRSKPDGEIRVAGRRVSIGGAADAVAAGVYYLPEDRLRQGLCRGLSVRANVVLSSLRSLGFGPLAHAGRERRAAREQVADLGIRCRSVEQPVGELSGGNQQKVVFARGRRTRPRVLILDEPTRGVDVAAKEEVHALIAAAAREGAAVVLISSELPEILDNADRIVVFREGRVAAELERVRADAEAVAAAALPGDACRPAPPARPSPRSKRRASPVVWTEAGLFAALLLLALLLAATHPRFLSAENLAAIGSSAAVWTILGLGAAAVIIAGGIDISIGSILALSAAAAGLVMKLPGPAPLVIAAGAAAGLAVGVVAGMTNAALALAGGIHPIVVTLGTLTVYRGVLLLITGGEVILDLPPALVTLAAGRIWGVPGAVLWMLLAVAAAAVWLGATPSGRRLYAVGASPRAGLLCGIGRPRTWLVAFGAGGLAAGAAGILELALTGSMQSRLGAGYELRAIAAAVIGGTSIQGGRGSALGVLLGALFLSTIQNALVLWGISPYRYDLVLGGLLLAAVLVDWGVRRLAP